MKQFIANVWNGQTYSLGKHYWLLLWLPSLILSFITGVLTVLLGGVAVAAETPIWDAWLAIVIGVTAIGYIGLINCARRERWRGWAITAVVVSTLGILNGLAQLTKPLEKSDIADEVGQLNQTLPERLDEVTTFSKASYDDKSGILTFIYQLDDTGQPGMENDEARANFVSEACTNLKGKYIYVKKILAVYKTRGRPDKVFQVTQEDCRR